MPDTLLGGIVINEFLVDPNGAINFDTDGNGVAANNDEFVELYNTSATAIDISGLELWDAGVGNWFTFPAGTILQPGAHAMVIVGVQSGGSLPTGGPDDLFFDAGRGSAVINNGGDNIVVYDPVNDEFIQATFNGAGLDDPTLGAGGYSGFSSTATRSGLGEDFGNDVDGQSLQREGDGNTSFVSATPTPGVTNICFSSGTRLAGPKGEIAVEALKPGDRLLTADHGVQTVRWIYRKTWSHVDLLENVQYRPLRIPADALAPGVPHEDLIISQQHRIVLTGSVVQRMFEVDEVFVPAKALWGMSGIATILPRNGVCYHHVFLDRHEVLFSHGVAFESLQMGAMAQQSIPASALCELQGIMGKAVPDLVQDPARLSVGLRRARRLIERHIRNAKPLCTPRMNMDVAA